MARKPLNGTIYQRVTILSIPILRDTIPLTCVSHVTRKDYKMSNWQVTTYDENDNITETFLIENRTEKEAEREAMHSVEVRSSDDWTMKEIEDE